MILNEWIIVFRLVLAAILSGMIGYEREFHGRAAGFRTHILLCIGSTLVMLTSMHIFDIYYTKAAVDPARIAAGVVTGIGFLGAGAIIHSKSSIKGLTTAASLWVVAAIGLGVGSGLYLGSIVTTVLTLVALMIFSRIEHSMIRKDWYRTIVIEAKDGADQLKAIRETLAGYRNEITDFEADRAKDSANMVLKLGLKLYEPRLADHIMEDIGRLDGVKSVKWEIE
ncbi:MAG: MgtC/SapB family protein [Candidatus Omnitrophota bacterium]|nr:MgtC/SapB family protein [Candidatus Omnitrophota bacterium]